MDRAGLFKVPSAARTLNSSNAKHCEDVKSRIYVMDRAGFEPTASPLPAARSTRLNYLPDRVSARTTV